MKKQLIRLTESDLHRIINDSVNKLLNELHHTTYQNASEQAFDNEDNRLYSFRKQAEKTFNDEDKHKHNKINNDIIKKSDLHSDNFIKLNNGKKLIIFDDEYNNLDDLYNGIKCGKLLVHARGMVGEISDNMRYIYPCFSETLLMHYGGEYEYLYDSKKEYYDDDFDDNGVEYPELIFASDNFSWVSSDRNYVFFIDSDGFQKSLGNGMIQLPNGRICKYYEGDVYDYESDLFSEEPICCEYGDWYSNKITRVIAIMNIK